MYDVMLWYILYKKIQSQIHQVFIESFISVPTNDSADIEFTYTYFDKMLRIIHF